MIESVIPLIKEVRTQYVVNGGDAKTSWTYVHGRVLASCMRKSDPAQWLTCLLNFLKVPGPSKQLSQIWASVRNAQKTENFTDRQLIQYIKENAAEIFAFARLGLTGEPIEDEVLPPATEE